MPADPPLPPKAALPIDPRSWALGVVDGFHQAAARASVSDAYGYQSGRVEGEAAREQGLTVDAVLVKSRSPYREAQLRPQPLKLVRKEP